MFFTIRKWIDFIFWSNHFASRSFSRHFKQLDSVPVEKYKILDQTKKNRFFGSYFQIEFFSMACFMTQSWLLPICHMCAQCFSSRNVTELSNIWIKLDKLPKRYCNFERNSKDTMSSANTINMLSGDHWIGDTHHCHQKWHSVVLHNKLYYQRVLIDRKSHLNAGYTIYHRLANTLEWMRNRLFGQKRDFCKFVGFDCINFLLRSILRSNQISPRTLAVLLLCRYHLLHIFPKVVFVSVVISAPKMKII